CTVPCDTCQSRRAPCDTCYSDNPARTDYFRDTGDDNTWQDRRSLAYRVTWGLTKRVRRNEFELGLEHQSQTAQYVTIENPGTRIPRAWAARTTSGACTRGSAISTWATGWSSRASPPT